MKSRALFNNSFDRKGAYVAQPAPLASRCTGGRVIAGCYNRTPRVQLPRASNTPRVRRAGQPPSARKARLAHSIAGRRSWDVQQLLESSSFQRKGGVGRGGEGSVVIVEKEDRARQMSESLLLASWKVNQSACGKSWEMIKCPKMSKMGFKSVWIWLHLNLWHWLCLWSENKNLSG